MDQEINIPEEHKELISSIISISEIQTFLQLQEKMAQAELAIVKAEKELAEKLEQKQTHSGPVPYYVTLTLTSDVSISSNDEAVAPESIEKKSQSYVIEFIDKNYEILIDRIYNKLTDVITEACKELVTVPSEEQQNVDTATQTRSE